MKIRSDFVTNSSSSSFIIGKRTDSITVETTFNMLKGLYQEYIDKFNKLKQECNKFGIVWDEEKGSFEGKKGRDFYDLDREIEKEYGISLFEYARDFSWMDFDTYKDYEQFWVEKLKKLSEDEYIEAPFSIIDYTQPNQGYRIDYGKYCLKDGFETCKASESEIFGWYISCGDYIFHREDEDYYNTRDLKEAFSKEHDICQYCSVARDYRHCKVFKQLQKGKKEGTITDENAVSIVLGKVCIHSECGRIPDYVVGKLRNISNYSCNHMG